MGLEKVLDLEFGRLPSIRRFPISKDGKEVKCKTKTVMPQSEVEELLDGKKRVIVEEKMNGTAKVFRAGEFWLFVEDMYINKLDTGVYVVPARYALWDVYNKWKKKFVSFVEKEDIFRAIKRDELQISEINSYNLFLVPLIAQGNSFKLEDMPAFLNIPSRYAIDPKTKKPIEMEGIVVKPARELFLPEYEKYVAKLIYKEYFFGESGIDENYLRKPLKRNIINPSLFLFYEDKNFLGRKTEPNE
jgi:hypothetical protein